jgi:hypothetical protein
VRRANNAGTIKHGDDGFRAERLIYFEFNGHTSGFEVIGFESQLKKCKKNSNPVLLFVIPAL